MTGGIGVENNHLSRFHLSYWVSLKLAVTHNVVQGNDGQQLLSWLYALSGFHDFVTDGFRSRLR